MSNRVLHIPRWYVWGHQSDISIPIVAIRGCDLGKIISSLCYMTQLVRFHVTNHQVLLFSIFQKSRVGLQLSWVNSVEREFLRNFFGAKKMPFFSPRLSYL